MDKHHIIHYALVVVLIIALVGAWVELSYRIKSQLVEHTHSFGFGEAAPK